MQNGKIILFGKKVGHEITFDNKEYLFISLSSSKLIKVKVTVSFRGEKGLKYGTTINFKRRVDMNNFDLTKFTLGRGSIKDKKTVLTDAIKSITGDKTMIKHCKEVVNEIKAKRMQERQGVYTASAVVRPTSLNRVAQLTHSFAVQDSIDSGEVDFDFIKKNTDLASKHRECD